MLWCLPKERLEWRGREDMVVSAQWRASIQLSEPSPITSDVIHCSTCPPK